MNGRLVGPDEVGVQRPSNPTKLVAPGMPRAASPDLNWRKSDRRPASPSAGAIGQARPRRRAGCGRRYPYLGYL